MPPPQTTCRSHSVACLYLRCSSAIERVLGYMESFEWVDVVGCLFLSSSVVSHGGSWSRLANGTFRSSHQTDYLTWNPFSPDLVEMSSCSTPLTLEAEGPLLRCWTNSLIASDEP
jgi:hypothetical protein